MRAVNRAGTVLAVAVAALGWAPSEASALECVVGVHGTGDPTASSAPGSWDGTLSRFANRRPTKIVDDAGTSDTSFDERACGRIAKQTQRARLHRLQAGLGLRTPERRTADLAEAAMRPQRDTLINEGAYEL